MPPDLDAIFIAQGDVATSSQILDHLSRGAMQRLLRRKELARVWPNIYTRGAVDTRSRLSGLDLRCGEPVAICLGTAARMHGFDTQEVADLHVINPVGHQLRHRQGLVVHRRDGAPLITLKGRLATAPAWTAVEVARGLRRPRALATLDQALRSRTCNYADLCSAAAAQAGRRGIVAIRDLIALASPLADSPMESEARLVMLDAGLPEPVLQYEIIDRDGRLWRVDFAWPDQMVAVEYEGFEWHSKPADLRHDRQKRAALEELGWSVMGVVSDDVRRRPQEMVRRIWVQLRRPRPTVQ